MRCFRVAFLRLAAFSGKTAAARWASNADGRYDEVNFLVEEPPEGGFTARALGASIFTEADTVEELRTALRDAVNCHNEPESLPKVLRLHFVRDEVIAN